METHLDCALNEGGVHRQETFGLPSIEFASMPTLSSLLLADDEDESSPSDRAVSAGAQRHSRKMRVGRRQRRHRPEKTKPKKEKQSAIGKEVQELMSSFSELMVEASDIKNIEIPTKQDFQQLESFVRKELYDASLDVRVEFTRLGQSSAGPSDAELVKDLNAASRSKDDVMKEIMKEVKELADTVREFDD